MKNILSYTDFLKEDANAAHGTARPNGGSSTALASNNLDFDVNSDEYDNEASLKLNKETSSKEEAADATDETGGIDKGLETYVNKTKVVDKKKKK
jgi:hypothetical protein